MIANLNKSAARQGFGGIANLVSYRSPLWVALLKRLTVLVILGLACTSLAADKDSFDAQSITPNGKYILSVPVQFDGVAANELLILTRDEQRGRRLSLYQELSPKNFPSNPTLAAEVPASVFAIQVVDIDNDRREEIVLLGLDALYVLDHDDGGYAAAIKEIGRFDRLYTVPAPEYICDYSFMFDLDADRIPEAVVPSWDGLRILKKDRNGYTQIRSVAVEHRCAYPATGNVLREHARRDFSVSMPTLSVQDLNADRSSDILVASASGLAVLHQLGDLQFSINPDQLLQVKAAFLENLRFTSWGLADLNNDKLTDYCRVFTQGRDGDFKTILEVFLGNAQLGYPQRPSKRIVIDQFGIGFALADLDGDGSSSVILATISAASTNLVKSLLMQRIGVELSIFESEGGVFAEQAKFVKKLNCGIDFFGNDLPTRFIGCFDGDLDRDQIKDLVSISDDDELEIYRGTKNPHFSDKPVVTREATRCSSVDAHDLNLDGKGDLVVFGWDEDGREQVTVLWSK